MEPLKISSINTDNFPAANNVEDNINLDYSADNDEEDADLIRLAEERISNDNGVRYTMEEIDEILGFTEKDLEGWEEVEIE